MKRFKYEGVMRKHKLKETQVIKKPNKNNAKKRNEKQNIKCKEPKPLLHIDLKVLIP